MPPKELDRMPTAEVSKEQKLRAFKQRFFDEVLEANDKESGVFRGPDSRYLYLDQIENFFIEVAKESGFSFPQAKHLVHYYLQDFFEQIKSKKESSKKEQDRNKQKEIDEERRNTQTQLLSVMRDIINDPISFGIDTEKNNQKREELQYTDDNAEFDNFDRLNQIVLGVVSEDSDEYTVPDPFYVNGRLPMPNVIADACKRLYEKWYPETSSEEMLARKLIKERCIDQVINELKQVEENRTKEPLDPKSKKEKTRAIIDKLTKLMRQIAQQEYMDAYVNMIAGGPYRENVTFPNDMVHLSIFYKRPPYNLTDALPAGPEKTKANVDFYTEVYRHLSPEDVQIAIAEFDAGSNAFFRDEVGPISPTAAYAKLEIIFLQKGFTTEQIQSVCAGYMADVVNEMVEFENEYVDLHKRRGQVANVEELKDINKRITQMKNSGRGDMRKKLLEEARRIVRQKEFINELPVPGNAESLRLALEGSTEEQVGNEESVFSFDYGTLSDQDARIEEGERLIKAVDEFLNSYLRSKAANAASRNDQYPEVMGRHGKVKYNLGEVLRRADVPGKNEVQQMVGEIESTAMNLIAMIETADQSEESVINTPS